jgi:ribokinase
MIAGVGRDVFGDGTLENFASFDIDTTYVAIDDEAPSGVAPIAVAPDGNNAIIIVTGANDRITRDHVKRARPAIVAARVVVCQLEIPLEITTVALEVAREESTRRS